MKVVKVRVVLEILKERGCREVRVSGSHQIWEMPNGERFPVVINHKNAEASRIVLATIRRQFRAAGLGEPF